jgi:EAL domain-containing protein (putative c-di-GMP-specific phosphodiesterase class I)/PAS domain-containing protein
MADRDLQRFVALAFCRADLLFELDRDHAIVFAAGATPRLLGRPPESLKGQPFAAVIAEADHRLTADLLKAAAAMGRIEDVAVRLAGAGGHQPTVALSGYRVPDIDNHFFLALKVDPMPVAPAIDPGTLAREPETGLMDEGSFSTLAAQRVEMLRRSGGRPQLSLVRIDKLDELTRTLQPSDRQKLMKTVGSILKEASLCADSAGKVDPTTFSVVHSDEVDMDDVARQIVDGSRGLDPDGKLAVRSRTLDADGAGMSEEQVAQTIVHAINAFCADETSFGKRSLSQVLQGMVASTIDNVAKLRRIAASRAFDIVFMPICDLRVGRVHHFEALVRFHELGQGQSPYTFIALAEEVGVIGELDLAITAKTLEVYAKLLKRGNLPGVAINMSGKSVTDETFLSALGQLLKTRPVDPKKVMFEITESAKIEKLDVVNSVIHRMGEMGHRFCLDDFGSGATGLDYLNALDVDFVKFDGPVIKRAVQSSKGRDVLAGVARTCSGLGVKTVAEMVENAEIAAAMASIGVNLGQGWYFGKPTPDPFSFAERFGA